MTLPRDPTSNATPDSGPLISVIIASYNAADCLARAVTSVQRQSCQDFEILVVDDASTDDTVALARSLAAEDPRVRVLRQSSNQGPSAARNLGLGAATGTWVAVLDADDAMHPRRLEGLLDTAARTGADIVADNLVPYDHGADAMLAPAFDWDAEHRLTLDLLMQRDVYMGGNPLGWIKPMWKRQFLLAHDLKYPIQYRHAEDFYLLAASLLEQASFWLRPEATYIYTLRHGPVSGTRSPFSASQPDLASIAASCEDLLARYQGRLTPAQKQQLSGRVRRFMQGSALIEVRRLLGEGRIWAAGAKAVASPGALALYAQVKVSSLKRRLGLVHP